jgi:hypothetical protein
MNMTKKSIMVSGAGWIAGFTDKLISALRERGVSDEDIHSLATDAGTNMVGKITDAIVAHLGEGNFTIHWNCEQTRVYLVHYHRSMVDREAENALKQDGYKSLNEEQLERFAKKYSHLGHMFPIVALGSWQCWSNGRKYPILTSCGINHASCAGNNPNLGEFTAVCRFAATR